VKFRRKSRTGEVAEAAEESGSPAAEESSSRHGPWDIDDLPADDKLPRVDLGSLLIVPVKDRELRLQVDEKSQTVQALLFTGQDGAMEIRAFAAPRNGAVNALFRQQQGALEPQAITLLLQGLGDLPIIRQGDELVKCRYDDLTHKNSLFCC
jgi:hypothetical protein